MLFVWTNIVIIVDSANLRMISVESTYTKLKRNVC